MVFRTIPGTICQLLCCLLSGDTKYSILITYLTLRLLMSYIYGAPSKARNANVVYI